ncbi:MAG: hypothetical protein IPL35_03815 [Sphingobacteriales bacterium]|nr:hypothetical protein [Sphingobacteriales bacterium]
MSFANLQPFESRSINLTLNLNSPQETPPLNIGDVLNFLAYSDYPQTDETPTTIILHLIKQSSILTTPTTKLACKVLKLM